MVTKLPAVRAADVTAAAAAAERVSKDKSTGMCHAIFAAPATHCPSMVQPTSCKEYHGIEAGFV
jgi:hypothetical protein